MPNKTYKAIVFLNPEKITFTMPKTGKIALPALETGISTDKSFILEYVKELYKQGIICAYRMCYCLDENSNNFYMDSNVVYFDDTNNHYSRVPGFIEEDYKQ